MGIASESRRLWPARIARLAAVALVVGISVSIFIFRDQLKDLGAVGYPGVFLVSLLGNATVILPAPSLAIVFAMGGVLSPLYVGLVAGVGEALGEMTGYLAGYGGRAVIENLSAYKRLAVWMKRAGGITVFVLSLIPNPFVDLAGIAAGSLHYPVWRFLLFCWMGKTLKTVLVAWAGAKSFTAIEPFLH